MYMYDSLCMEDFIYYYYYYNYTCLRVCRRCERGRPGTPTMPSCPPAMVVAIACPRPLCWSVRPLHLYLLPCRLLDITQVSSQVQSTVTHPHLHHYHFLLLPLPVSARPCCRHMNCICTTGGECMVGLVCL